MDENKMTQAGERLLTVDNLKTTFMIHKTKVEAVRGASIHVDDGDILAVVGESGSGKSVLMKSIMGLLPENAQTTADSLVYMGRNLLELSADERRKMRGKEFAMIFQDPMTALNPLKKIGAHLTEVLMRYRKLNKKQALIIGLYFGGFQALMPFVGWLLGSQFQKYITSIDHWIAFILLGFIGGKMMIEAVREWNEEEVVDVMDAPIDHKNMLVLAVATSIDALTVGITFAFLGTPIVEAITIIGITTMVISIAGVVVGNFFGSRYKSKAEFIGGLILVLLGLKILLEHLGILVF